jgi:hypothetical protein
MQSEAWREIRVRMALGACIRAALNVLAMAFFPAVVALSILTPGRRTARVNPIHALRHE